MHPNRTPIVDSRPRRPRLVLALLATLGISAAPACLLAAGAVRVTTMSPPDESYIDPEIQPGGNWMAFQVGDEVWLGELDPLTGLFRSASGRDVRLDTDVAPMRETFNGPEFGVDSAGWSVYYTKWSRDGAQIWRSTWKDGRTDSRQITSGERHQSAIVSKASMAPSTRLLVVRGDWSRGTVTWLDVSRPEVAHDVVPVSEEERRVNSPRWIDGTLSFVYSHRDGPARGQIEIVNTQTGQAQLITSDGGDKTFPYAWPAPEFGGEKLLLALVDNQSIGVYRDMGGEHWRRIADLGPPSGSRNRYVGSAEPFVANGRSYVSLVIKSEPARTRGFGDGEVWILGIEPDPRQRFSLRCDDGDTPVMRFDPEIFAGRDEIFVYYNERRGRALEIARCGTGIRP
jgi:hypothetical protein